MSEAHDAAAAGTHRENVADPQRVGVGGAEPAAGRGEGRRARTVREFLRKLLAIVLVLAAVTTGIIGLMFTTEGHPWGLLLIAATPLGIWLATKVTPEGGTTGYFDKNI